MLHKWFKYHMSCFFPLNRTEKLKFIHLLLAPSCLWGTGDTLSFLVLPPMFSIPHAQGTYSPKEPCFSFGFLVLPTVISPEYKTSPVFLMTVFLEVFFFPFSIYLLGWLFIVQDVEGVRYKAWICFQYFKVRWKKLFAKEK